MVSIRSLTVVIVSHPAAGERHARRWHSETGDRAHRAPPLLRTARLRQRRLDRRRAGRPRRRRRAGRPLRQLAADRGVAAPAAAPRHPARRRPPRPASRPRRSAARRSPRRTASTATLAEVEPVDPDAAAAAAASYPGHTFHPFPTCFACGTAREEGDGLRIFPGPVGDGPRRRDRVAATWTPHPSLDEDWHTYVDEHPRASVAVDLGRARLRRRLGRRPRPSGSWCSARMTARHRRRCRSSASRTSWSARAAAGTAARPSPPRRCTTPTAASSATAEHTWIAVDPASFGGRAPSSD